MADEVIDGRYELRGLIGSGGMARVYRGFDRTLKREVAVKMLVGDTVDEAASVERFRREARAAANLNHPNIVGIYDWGETSPNGHHSYFMVMELVPGENLKEIIDRRGPLPEPEALDIAAQIAAALQAAQGHGVVHRDVKPQNILVGGSGQVKMTDFGIARAAGLTQLTATDAICGTPYYLSPEQAQRRPLDNRSDIYGLGVVLYEMLTGTELFHGSPLEVAMRHVQEEAPSPRRLQPGLSAPTEAIVRKALAKKPRDRFQTAADMHRALRQAHNRLALADQQPTAPAAPPARPPRTPGTAGLTTQWRMRQPAAQPYLRKDGTPENPWLRVTFVAVLIAAFTGGLAYLNARNSTSHARAPTASSPLPTRAPHRAARLSPAPTATHVGTGPRATATVASTPAPTATSPPPSSAPTSGVAVALSSLASDPGEAVLSFYRLVSAHRFAEAAALWSPHLRVQDPPYTYINQRFQATRSIVITSYAYTIDKANGTAAADVQVLETLDSGVPQAWTGTWNLVLGPSGWLLDSNDLVQRPALVQAGPPHGRPQKHHATPPGQTSDKPKGHKHDKRDEGD
jgi:serine/threonine protein kinase